MRLAVFGATGRTGLLIVRQAVDAGHHVTAFARRPEALGAERENVTVALGDVRDSRAVAAAVRGSQAVLSALGTLRLSEHDALRSFARAVVPAMREAGVRRIVALTGTGVSEEGDIESLGLSLSNALIKRLAGEAVRDAYECVETIAASELDWTIVRAPFMTGGPLTRRYRTGTLRMGLASHVSRADVAHFMLALAADSGLYARRMPMIRA